MREKFILYITDETITLYKGSSERLCRFGLPSQDIHLRVNDFLSSSPQTPLCLFIDRAHQDIHEEKLPPLFPWDRLRLLFHKKTEWFSQGGYVGYDYIKQEKTTYLRWIHIPASDPLMEWFFWAQSLPNPKGGIFFVPLEAGGFLKKQGSPSNLYKMLVYPLPPSKTRHVVFKGNCLLLSRLSDASEDPMVSLHFLSRKYPDIHEKVHVVSLLKDTPLTLSHMDNFPDSQAFFKYLTAQSRPSLPLRPNVPSGRIGLRRGASLIICCGLTLSTVYAWQGFKLKEKSLHIMPYVDSLHMKVNDLTLHIEGKDIPSLRTALEHYQSLKSHIADPLKAFTQLSLLLNKHGVRLQSLKWHHENNLEMVLTFFMKEQERETLIPQFEDFLKSCSTLFPESKVHVVEAPFNSSTHEILKDSIEEPLPKVQVRIVLP